jgi:hypothetical protein
MKQGDLIVIKSETVFTERYKNDNFKGYHEDLYAGDVCVFIRKLTPVKNYCIVEHQGRVGAMKLDETYFYTNYEVIEFASGGSMSPKY